MDVGEVRNQEDQLGLNLLASVEPSVYYLDGHAHGTQGAEGYLCGWSGRYNSLSLLLIGLQFIEIDLTREYQLNDLEEVKPTLDAQDFLELLQYHWLSDTNVFAAELQRVQLASILLAAAFTGSRPSALLAIEYRDLDLFLLRDPTSGLPTMVLRVTLTKTKGQAKRKRP